MADRLRSIGADAALRQQVFAEAVRQDGERLAELEAHRRALEEDLAHWKAQARQHALGPDAADAGGAAPGLLADLPGRIAAAEQQLARAKEELYALRRRRLDEGDVAAALGQFGPAWEALAPREQARLVQLLVAKVEYDGKAGKVSITFHPPGIKALADELAGEAKEARA